MDIPWGPAVDGVVIYRIPNICLHLHRDIWWDVAGMFSKAERTFSYLLGMSLIWCSFMLISYPRAVFFVDQSASPRGSLFVEIGSFRRQSVAALGRKTVSIPPKRWWSICVRSLGPPWKVEIKSSR